jgi:hypothetical protein
MSSKSDLENTKAKTGNSTQVIEENYDGDESRLGFDRPC